VPESGLMVQDSSEQGGLAGAVGSGDGADLDGQKRDADIPEHLEASTEAARSKNSSTSAEPTSSPPLPTVPLRLCVVVPPRRPSSPPVAWS